MGQVADEAQILLELEDALTAAEAGLRFPGQTPAQIHRSLMLRPLGANNFTVYSCFLGDG
jgi:hypothetical protein